ncbi:hypothetical protein KP509_1Z027900 [Ceratopteris richardii]|nr:hypothetical protein KP509_1Z027900 [Ceratopteris richardii]
MSDSMLYTLTCCLYWLYQSLTYVVCSSEEPSKTTLILSHTLLKRSLYLELHPKRNILRASYKEMLIVLHLCLTERAHAILPGYLSSPSSLISNW